MIYHNNLCFCMLFSVLDNLGLPLICLTRKCFCDDFGNFDRNKQYFDEQKVTELGRRDFLLSWNRRH